MGGGVAQVATFRAVSLFLGKSIHSPCYSDLLQFGGVQKRSSVGISVGVGKRLGLFDTSESAVVLDWRRRQRVVCAAQNVRKELVPGQVIRIPVIERDSFGQFRIKDSGDAADSSDSTPAVLKIKPSRSINVKENASLGGKSSTLKNLRGSALSSSGVTTRVSSKFVRSVARPKAENGPPQYSKAARRFFNERFRAEPQRLSKVLAAAGVASRRGSEDVIFSGRVSVNGSVCQLPQTPVDPLKDVIYVDGHSLPKKLAPKMYFALNKPKGYICTAGDEGSKPVLSLLNDYFKVWADRNPGMSQPRMFTVGRLDVATSGLLLVTNDGEFAHTVSHPSSGLTKEYVVTVGEKTTRRQIQTIAQGTMVQGVQCVPTVVEVLDNEPDSTKQRLRIVVSEGRNHEVRYLVENAGLQVIGLKRVRIGGLRLSRKLRVGNFEPLTEAQVAKVLDKVAQNA